MKNFTIFCLLITSLANSLSANSVNSLKSLNSTACTVYTGTSNSGSSAQLVESIIYAGTSIPNGLNNTIKSFTLKQGYMATFAINENGTGKSKVYIASDVDLVVNALPTALQSSISFIRILPWVNVNKKGTGGLINGVDASWFYDWGNGQVAQPSNDYVPMTWGAGATSTTTLNQIIQKNGVTHLLGFNEPDDCNAQSGQYSNLCQPEVAVGYYENLMTTGLRLGTPAPRENGPSGWLNDFNTNAKSRDVRFDFVAVHWYDWGGNPQNTPNADPQAIFNRFKAYLTNVYQIYGLPIWITEFNANPNRVNSVHAGFLNLALPYLEQLDYIERYAFFQPNPISPSTVGAANFFDPNGNLTNIGTIYKNHISTPAIPEATFASPNNLTGLDDTPIIDNLNFEAEDATLTSQSAVLSCGSASNSSQVNMGANYSGGKVSFNNVMTSTAGTYKLTISYMNGGAASRNAGLFVNAASVRVISLLPSGKWCGVGGVPKDTTIIISLNSGTNIVEFRSNNGESPFLDKISLELLTALPIVISSINATTTARGVKVDWATTLEQNSDYMEIQKSYDGLVFKSLNTYESNGDSYKLNQYQYLDENPVEGVNYYRIKQVDLDGVVSYSKIVSAVVEPASKPSFKVYPTALIDQRTVTISSSAIYSGIKIYAISALGIVKSIGVTTQDKTISIDLSTLPKGNYYLALDRPDGLEYHPLVIF